jgi:regulator of protease activity HflC (stomatin/prohibitin superfamily)
MEAVLILLLVAVLLFLFFLAAFRPLRIVRDYERLVVFRLGRFIGERGPGLIWLWPVIDQAVRANLREDFLEIPSQTCITQDNAPIDIDFLIYWKVVDPGLSVLKVRDFAGASQGIATTTLRAVIGDIPLDDVLAKREQINQILRAKLDEVTERWGVKVTSVEIRVVFTEPVQRLSLGGPGLDTFRRSKGLGGRREAQHGVGVIRTEERLDIHIGSGQE